MADSDNITHGWVLFLFILFLLFYFFSSPFGDSGTPFVEVCISAAYLMPCYLPRFAESGSFLQLIMPVIGVSPPSLCGGCRSSKSFFRHWVVSFTSYQTLPIVVLYGDCKHPLLTSVDSNVMGLRSIKVVDLPLCFSICLSFNWALYCSFSEDYVVARADWIFVLIYRLYIFGFLWDPFPSPV